MQKCGLFLIYFEENTMLSNVQKEKIQTNLLAFTQHQVAKFLAEHPNETFYAFAYDCQSESAEVNLCFSTESWFTAELNAITEKYPEYYSTKEEILDFKYNTGNFQYQCFATIYVLDNEELNAIIEPLSDKEDWDALNVFMAEIMQIIRETLALFEHSEIYQQITKTHDFICYALDHEDDPTDFISL